MRLNREEREDTRRQNRFRDRSRLPPNGFPLLWLTLAPFASDLRAPSRACMSDSVTKKEVARTAAENGPRGSSEAAVLATVTLTLGERTSCRVARTRARRAA